MKRRTIITSVLVIVLCLGLISGSTFALFTSTSSVNIAVTSGKVDVKASLKTPLELYSANASVTTTDGKAIKTTDTSSESADGTLTGTFAGTYYYQAQTGVDENGKKLFANGGTASYTAPTLTIDRMTPGDKVATELEITNKSNVAIKYRLKIAATAEDDANAKILEVLKVKFEGILYTGLKNYTSSWITKQGVVNSETYNSKIEVIFPLDVDGEDYMDKTVQLAFTVEAVQSNANTSDTGSIDYVSPTSTPVVIATTTSVVTEPTQGTTTATLVAATAPTTEEKTTEVTLTNVGQANNTVKLTVETHDVSAAAATQYTIVSGDNVAAGSIDLTLTVNDKIVSQFDDNASAKIVTYVAKGLTGVNVIYNGDEDKTFGNGGTPADSEAEVDVGKFYYDATTGKLVFMTNHFSEYVVTTSAKVLNETTNTAYSSLEDAVTALKSGETIKLLRDIDLSKTYTVRNARDNDQGHVFDLKDCILDLNGNTIKSINGSVTFAGNGATIENGTFDLVEKDTDGSYKDGSYALIIDNAVAKYGKTGTVAVKDVTCDGGINVCCATVTLDNVTSHTTTTKYYAVWAETNATLTINSGVYTDTQTSGLGIIATGTGEEGGAKVYIKGGTFVGTNKLVYNTETNAIEIIGGTFDHDPTSYVVEGYGVQTVEEKYVVEALFDGGSGTENDPYLIANGNQWYNLLTKYQGYYMGSSTDGLYVVLKGDIDITGYDITSYNSYPRNFHLDGNGFTMKNFETSIWGEDGTLYLTNTFTNLKLENCHSSDTSLFGQTQNSDTASVTFNNVDLNNCSAIGGAYQYYDGSATATFIDCDATNTNVLGGYMASGGFVGNISTGVIVIDHCSFGGSVVSTQSACGGFIGQSANYDPNKITIKDSTIIAGTVIRNVAGGNVAAFNAHTGTQDYAQFNNSFYGTLETTGTNYKQGTDAATKTYEPICTVADFTLNSAEGTLTYNGSAGLGKIAVQVYVTDDYIYNGQYYGGYNWYVCDPIKANDVVNGTTISGIPVITDFYNVVSTTETPVGLQTIDTTYVDKIHDGIFYFDAQTYSWGHYMLGGTYKNGLAVEPTSLKVYIKVTVYDNSGSLMGVVSGATLNYSVDLTNHGN